MLIGLGCGYWLCLMYNVELVDTLKNDKARLENELAKIKAAAVAVKTDIEQV
jgi:hypothetical protein